MKIDIPITLWSGSRLLRGYVLSFESDQIQGTLTDGINLDISKDIIDYVADDTRDVIEKFHVLTFERPFPIWGELGMHQNRNSLVSYYKGQQITKHPIDLWLQHEIIWATKPELIIETGTDHGGSALWYAESISAWDGQVISIDIRNLLNLPKHDNITYWTMSSTCNEAIDLAKDFAKNTRTMVILDSNHSRDHVLKEMELYGPLVTPGCYMLVEDTDLNGHPVFPLHGPGPFEAVEEYLKTHDDFEVDVETECKFLLTMFPNGYLKKRANGKET